MKVRLHKDEPFVGWFESDYVDGPLVEIPDAIVIAFRETKQRLAELEGWLDENILLL
jgi:hypothetical protein